VADERSAVDGAAVPEGAVENVAIEENDRASSNLHRDRLGVIEAPALSSKVELIGVVVLSLRIEIARAV